uniref:PEP-CTERM sorting domain-containing protein n=1 Tax=Planktothricoides sp. SpSt-374 TaxID=2282167 RepID=A0A7C3ZKC0_9CYAN
MQFILPLIPIVVIWLLTTTQLNDGSEPSKPPSPTPTPTSSPTPPPPSNDPYPDAPGGPEPLTTLGSVIGAGGLVLLKKRRSEKDKFSKGESLP